MIEEISGVDHPITSTKIHGVITSVSHQKGLKLRVFGIFADETAKMRMVGFDDPQHRKLREYHERNVPVELVNCEVRSSKYGDGYELMLEWNENQRVPEVAVHYKSFNCKAEMLL